jgi:anthranilate phosphoribosyltransferase
VVEYRLFSVPVRFIAAPSDGKDDFNVSLMLAFVAAATLFEKLSIKLHGIMYSREDGTAQEAIVRRNNSRV